MRRIWTFAGLLILVGLAVIGYRFLATTGSVDIDVERPIEARTTPLPDLEGRIRVSLPVRVSIAEMTRLVNRAAVSQSGEIDDPIGHGNVVDDRLRWEVTRSDISLIPDGRGIGLSAGLTGTAHASGRIRIAGGLGSLLDRLNAGGIPFSQNADLRAALSVTAQPVVQENWSIAPHLGATVQIEEAELPIARFGSVNLGPVLQPFLDRAVAASLSELQAKIENPALLRSALQPIWSELCGVYPVEADGTRIWGIIRPISVGAASPEISNEGVLLAASIEAEVSLVATQEALDPAVCGPLPDLLDVLQADAAGQADLKLPVIVDWNWLEDQLEAEFQDPIESAFGQLTLDQPEVHAFGQQLLIGIRLELISSKALAPDIKGQIWLTATPELDKAKGAFRLKNIMLTTETANALGRVASWMADNTLAAFLGREISVDLSDLEERVLAEANAQIESMVASLEDTAKIGADLQSFRIDGFAVTPSGFAILLDATGRVGVEDLRLDFME